MNFWRDVAAKDDIMDEWDGNDYQLYARAIIALSIPLLILDRIKGGDWQLFSITIFFLLIAMGMVPKGPRPPVD